MNKRIVLASGSPRRKELFQLLDLPFEVIVPNIEETLDVNLPLEASIMKLAKEKALNAQASASDACVIGCDTIVSIHDEVYGKPSNEEDARRMLKGLSGKTHHVITGCCIRYRDYEDIFYSTAKVTFYDLSDKEIDYYISTQEPFGKAGAYGIQGYAARFIKGIVGDYYSVVGFPVAMVYQKMKELPF